jgi:hypothetical protein
MIDFGDDIKEMERMLDPEFLVKAKKSALKATQRKTATRISKLVRQEFNVTARAVADRLKLSLGRNDTEAYLRYVGTRIGLINFSGKFKKVRTTAGRRLGATAKVKKTARRYVAPGGFIAEGNNGNVHIFQRMSKRQRARMPIRKMTGPAIPQMVSQQEVLDEATKFVEQEYPKDLTNRLDYFLTKQMGK